jgi:putative transposase
VEPERRGELASWPVPRPRSWRQIVNEPQTAAEEQAVRTSIQRSRPFGGAEWTAATIDKLGLEWTLRPRGRPKKN